MIYIANTILLTTVRTVFMSSLGLFVHLLKAKHRAKYQVAADPHD